MEVEVVVPAVDFNFDSNCSSPFITAPSSPQFFSSNKPNFFFSAPTSPTRSVPTSYHNDNDHDFEFNCSGHLQRPSLSADELFDSGKIRPLKPPPPPPCLQSPLTSPSSKLSPHNKTDFDQEAMEEEEEEEERGRERVSGRRKGSRSLSPLRISDIVCDSEEKNVSSSTSNNKTSSFLSSIPFTRKWRFRDFHFLLFRSASEGRATDKDSIRRRYVALSKNEDVRNCSFRSTESSGSVSKRRGPVSAHEIHYTLNRAASEEMKKKTFLPYKQGLLGCLGFNPGNGMQHLSKGVGSLTRS